MNHAAHNRAHARRSPWWAAIAVAASAALALSACSSAPANEGTGASDSAAERVSLKIGASASLLATSLHLAADTSAIFDDAGFDVEFTTITSMTEGVTQILSGDVQMIVGDVHNTILAQSEGMPIVMVAPIAVGAAEAAEDGVGFGNVMVLKDGPISSAKDLEGQTVGTNTINGTGYLDSVTVMNEEGINTDSIDWVAIPGAQQLAALRQGQVAAITIAEPNATKALLEGDTKVIATSDAALPGAPLYGLVSTTEWLNGNRDAAERFQAALIEANAVVNADRAAANEAIASFVDLPAEVIETARLPLFAVEAFEPANIETTIARLEKFGILESSKVPDIQGLFAQYN